MSRNVIQLTEIASRLAESDHLDSLTGVENRNHFHDHLEQMLQREGGGYALLTKCNVSRFHDINTSFGYDVGDALLIQVEQRLRTLFYAVGRVRDDSIGLLRKAGIALHESKRSPFLDPIEFDRNAAIRIESRVRLTSDLQQALENSEFLMHYQPKVELATGKIVGAEALLRWEHAVYGTQPPGRFIPIAEESGLIVDIGAWALRHVARFAVRVNRGRPTPLAFSVNVSQLQFRRDDVAQLLRTILEQTDAEPSWLMLELTESLLADNSPAMIGTLRELRAMGVGLSVDDFGTGYSSLSRLEAFPISEFKIDRSFVSQVDQNRSKHVIVDAMIRLGKELQISVVAEGAKTKDEVSVLRKLGCPYAQGYFFGRPMPEAKFVPLLDGKVLSFDQNDVVHRPSGVCAAGRSQSAAVIDDDPISLATRSETLEHLGLMVTTASSPEEVLALPESFPTPSFWPRLGLEAFRTGPLRQGAKNIAFLADPTTGELRIGCPESTAGGFLQMIIEKFASDYPGISLQVDLLTTPALNLPALRMREMDLALTRLPHSDTPADQDLNVEVLFDDEVIVVAGARSRWARYRQIELADLADARWILTPAGSLNPELISEAFEINGLKAPRITLTTFSVHLRNHFLATNRFVAAMPVSLLQPNADKFGLKALPIKLPVRRFSVAVVTLKNRTLGPVAELFIEHLRKHTKSTTL